MKRLVLALFVGLTGMLLLAGCGGSGNNATGTLQVAITDKMSAECAKVVVSIREIRAVPAGRENAPDDSASLPVVARFATPQSIDVMSLQFQAQLIGQAVIPAGTYTQLRLILEDNPNGNGQDPVNYLTLTADTAVPRTKYPLKTPSGQQSGLKVLGHFTVTENRITAMMIDFDPDTAIVDRGNGDYNLKPTGIRLVKLDSMLLTGYGSLTGTVFAPTLWNGEAFIAVKKDGVTVASGAIFANLSSNSYLRTPFSAFVPAAETTGTYYKTYLSASGFNMYSSPLTLVHRGVASFLGDIQLSPTQ